MPTGTAVPRPGQYTDLDGWDSTATTTATTRSRVVEMAGRYDCRHVGLACGESAVLVVVMPCCYGLRGPTNDSTKFARW